MSGYHLRVGLLTLGVVLGYGSAAAHLYRHGMYGGHGHCHRREHHAQEHEQGAFERR